MNKEEWEQLTYFEQIQILKERIEKLESFLLPTKEKHCTKCIHWNGSNSQCKCRYKDKWEDKPKDSEITMAGSLSVSLMRAREEIERLTEKCERLNEEKWSLEKEISIRDNAIARLKLQISDMEGSK